MTFTNTTTGESFVGEVLTEPHDKFEAAVKKTFNIDGNEEYKGFAKGVVAGGAVVVGALLLKKLLF